MNTSASNAPPPIGNYIWSTYSGHGLTIQQYCFRSQLQINLMETDQEGDGGGRRGNPKERMPEKGPKLTE
jgi:hypothetical protein